MIHRKAFGWCKTHATYGMEKAGSHSIAWFIWHMTRIEDVTMNLLLAGSPEVFSSANWRFLFDRVQQARDGLPDPRLPPSCGVAHRAWLDEQFIVLCRQLVTYFSHLARRNGLLKEHSGLVAEDAPYKPQIASVPAPVERGDQGLACRDGGGNP